MYDNHELNHVLSLILAIGNRLNQGHVNRENASGFDLDILANLKDVKSGDGTLNLLQYIVKVYVNSTNIVSNY